jgi:hypothetical protein
MIIFGKVTGRKTMEGNKSICFCNISSKVVVPLVPGVNPPLREHTLSMTWGLELG